MTLLRRTWVFAVALFACGIHAFGEAPSVCSLAQENSAPCIDKIDPPGWWAGLPDPMLLVHGDKLQQVRFTLRGDGVTLIRTQSSDNGLSLIHI